MKINKKMLFISISVIIILLIAFFAIVNFEKNNKKEEVHTLKTEEEIEKENIYIAITQNVKFGDAKQTINEKIKSEKIGKNYIVNPNYTRIGKYDYLTTYIFKEDILIAILHERMLDGTQKHNLTVEFQKATAEIGELYPLIESKEEWFSSPLNYEIEVWNNAIIDNNLELCANFENKNTNEYVKIIASGINYFDFLAKDRENLSIGNINLIYTSNDYKDKFLELVSLSTE